MLITLDVLKSKNACEDGIEYFKSLEKQEWDVVELMERCVEDNKGDDNGDYAEWLFRCVETIEELKKAVELYIEKGWFLYYAFECCHKLFENDPALFKKAVEFHMGKGWSLHWAFEFCHKAFEKEPALFKKAVEFHIENGRHLDWAFMCCHEAFAKDLELFKKVVEYFIEKGRSLDRAFEYCNELFEKDLELHAKALEHQKQFLKNN